MALPFSDDPERSIEIAEARVEVALKQVHEANERYIEACRILATAKVEAARLKPHPWHNMSVYRIMGGTGIKPRMEHGVVSFKDLSSPDYGNPHIAPGSYYVLVDGKSAHSLNKDWEIDLL
jgi:hypothetical protein